MVLWFLLALFLVGVVWLVVSDNPLAQQVQEMLGWKHDQTILDNTFSVGPHTFRYYKFALAEGSVNVAVAGQFTATADTSAHSSKDKGSAKGPENNIEVYVLTEPAFTIWQNGYATSSLYEGGRVSEGTVQADIPAGAGIYYLVFNNKFSPKTAKAVRATVFLRYKSWLPEWFRRMKERFWNLLS